MTEGNEGNNYYQKISRNTKLRQAFYNFVNPLLKHRGKPRFKFNVDIKIRQNIEYGS